MTDRDPSTTRRPGRARRLAAALLAGALLLAAGAGASATSTIQDHARQLRLQVVDPQPAPPFTLTNLAGGSVSLADFKGHVVLLYFWATW